jgi:Zn-dependent protease
MRWSLKLGKIAGIEVYLHWTFFLLLGFVFFYYGGYGAQRAAAAQAVLFILALFGCIVLHELGHALAARKFGIPTRDITLLPIGGIARLERMPREPMQELWVAVAGPLVNVAIVLILLIPLSVMWFARVDLRLPGVTFLVGLFATNIFLIAFNMLPAFPMDGGRVLRALLARKLEYVRATRIAARVGQGMALLFIAAGSFGYMMGFQVIDKPLPMLVLIGAFIFVGARNEAHLVEIGRNIEPDIPPRPFSRNYPLRG